MRILALNRYRRGGAPAWSGRCAVVEVPPCGISDEWRRYRPRSRPNRSPPRSTRCPDGWGGGDGATAQGQRLVDLALNAIEIIDRNLYERTCDVRWWATDPAVVDAAAAPTAAAAGFASERLAVVLRAYTVYLDFWLVGLDGRVIASASRRGAIGGGLDVSGAPWFRAAAVFGPGTTSTPRTSAPNRRWAARRLRPTPPRSGAAGRPTASRSGVLAVHFDWEPQSLAVCQGVRLSADERARGRVLLVDAGHRVIAASDRARRLESGADSVRAGRAGLGGHRGAGRPVDRLSRHAGL